MKCLKNLRGPVDPFQLNFGSEGIAETGVIGQGTDAILLQGSGHFVALVPRQTVNNSAFAAEPLVDDLRHLRQHIGLHFFGKDAVLQIRPIE